jgi:bifunctional oligoribonuclease and PAP phosphatase NrnA
MSNASHGLSADDVESFKKLVAEHRNFIICAHENPDADAYGSSCGLGAALKELGKNILYLSASPISERLEFIPGVSEVVPTIPDGFEADCVILCDCGSFSRVGENVVGQLSKLTNLPIVNFDHHISNDLFGSLNIVVTSSSSTAEIICALLDSVKFPFTTQSAVALYAGIMADSGSFRYSCVRPYTFEAAAICVARGAVPHKISEKLFSNNSLTQVRLQSKAMLEMTLHLSARVALIVTTRQMLETLGASVSDSEGLAEQGRDIKGVIVSILMKEDVLPSEASSPDAHGKSLWRVSMRSKSEEVDLSALAQKFGGGGHRAAAAFRSSKPQQEIVNSLLSELDQTLGSIS